MLVTFEIVRDAGYPLPVKKPVPASAAYYLKVKTIPMRQWRKYELWVNVEYWVEDVGKGIKYDEGKFRNFYKLNFDKGTVTPEELYQVVDSMGSYLGIHVSHHYNERGGSFTVNVPKIDEVFADLKYCTEWINKRLTTKKRASKE
jgi:hypothetical protein